MMIETVVDELIKSVKQTGQFPNVSFYKNYRRDFAEAPTKNYSVVVKTDDVRVDKTFIGDLCSNQLKGELRKLNLILRLYTSGRNSGNSLSNLALRLLSELREADSGGFIDRASISRIEYDTDTGEVYRDIKAELSFVACEAV